MPRELLLENHPPPELRECRDCGLMQRLGPIAMGEVATCGRCGATLRRPSDNRASLACAIAATCLFAAALELPILEVRAAGRFQEGTIMSGPIELERLGRWDVGAIVLATLVLAPMARLLLHVAVLAGSRAARPSSRLLPLFATLVRLRPWSMADVFLLGGFVAYTRIHAIASVGVGPGAVALIAATVAMLIADSCLDEHAVWEALGRRSHRAPPRLEEAAPLVACDACGLVTGAPSGTRCPRCGFELHRRKPRCVARAWALGAAAALLYIPANALPVMSVTRMGRGGPSTIAHGVVELGRQHLMPLAIVVFVASIVIPVIKLAALVAMLVMTARGSGRFLVARTKMFRVIGAIGRWSMIDIFALSTLVAMVQMGFLATVVPGAGALAFAAVVLLTMLATELFDPRVMWDSAASATRRVA